MPGPAARIGDQSAHGGAIVSGMPTVLIAGMPAARVADMHTCPMQTPAVPPIPHVGGPITMGMPTVLVGGMPQATIGSVMVCVGPPDSVVKGAPTVLIGTGGGGAGGGGGGGAGGGGGGGGPAGGAGGARGAMAGSAASNVRPAGPAQTTQQPDGSLACRWREGVRIDGDAHFVAFTLAAFERTVRRETGRAAVRAFRERAVEVRVVDGEPPSVGLREGSLVIGLSVPAQPDGRSLDALSDTLEALLWAGDDLVRRGLPMEPTSTAQAVVA